jgi:O-antigen/teichoic acid export membrane protein
VSELNPRAVTEPISQGLTAEGGPPSVRRLGLNTIAQAVGVVGGVVLGFATFLVVTRGLGPSAFGDLAASQVYLLIPVALADLGLSTSVLRDISVHPERTEFALRASLPFRAVVAAIALGAAVALSFVLPFSDGARLAIWVGAIGSLFTLLNLGLLPLLQAQLRMRTATIANLAGRMLTLLLTILAIATGHGFTSVVLAYVAGLVGTFVVDLVAVSRLISLRPIIALRYWWDLGRRSLTIGLALGLSLSYYRIDTVLVALVRGSREVGLYGAAFKFVELAEYLVATIGTSVFPSFTQMIASGDRRIRIAIERSIEVALAVGLPLILVMILMPRQLIELTAGPAYVSAAEALQVLAPYLALLFLSGLLTRVLGASYRDRFLLAVILVVLSLNVALNLLLLPVYGYKVAALISVASEAVVVAAALWLIYRSFGFVPATPYLGVIALAGGVMVAVFVALPGSPYVAAAVAAAAYALVLVAIPGTVRNVLQALLPRNRVEGEG